MRICYQSYVDEAHGAPYWDHLRRHLDEVSQPDRVGDAPVVNGIEIVVGMAEMAARLAQRSGLHISRHGTFVKAPEDIIEESLTHPVHHG